MNHGSIHVTVTTRYRRSFTQTRLFVQPPTTLLLTMVKRKAIQSESESEGAGSDSYESSAEDSEPLQKKPKVSKVLIAPVT
jgi:hypothetical protein